MAGNLLAVGLAAQAILLVAAVAAALGIADAHRRSRAAGTLSALLGIAALATGVLAATAGPAPLEPVRLTLLGAAGPSAADQLATGQLTHTLPALTLTLAPDPVAGLFMIVVGAVGALCAWFGIGYAHGAAASRTAWSAYPAFLAGLLLVTAAGDVVLFLTGWEVMALASTVLVAADHAHPPTSANAAATPTASKTASQTASQTAPEHTRPRGNPVRSAVGWYAALTHASFLAVLLGLGLLAQAAGSITFADISAMRLGAGAPAFQPGTPSWAGTVAFVLLITGFAMKAGLVPFHVWLPMAHPQAPSHVSAAMSAAMVKAGIFGIVLTFHRLLPHGPRWWAVVLLALGAVSALYGILQASVTSDLKRLLAYSTTENTGLIASALAASELARTAGHTEAATIGLVSALLLVISHAAFKTALFLGAGAVIARTGVRDLDEMGGLARTMPWTSAALTVGALGAAALPVTSGFAAEWLLLQSLVHGRGDDRLTAALMPAAVAVVALVAGMALLTFVKVIGIAVFSRPRTPGAAAREAAPGLLAPLLVAAGAVVGLGLIPGIIGTAAARAIGMSGVFGGGYGDLHGGGTSLGVERVGLAGLRLPSFSTVLDPLSLTLLAAAIGVPVLLVTRRLRARRPRRIVDLPWGCGGVRVDRRMQYTATSFAEPVMRVFADALRPQRDLSVTSVEESRYLLAAAEYRQEIRDGIEERAYRPALAALLRLGDLGRAVHNGSLRRYLSFAFAALLVVLVVVTL